MNKYFYIYNHDVVRNTPQYGGVSTIVGYNHYMIMLQPSYYVY